MGSEEPYEQILEFTRAEKAEDPYGFQFEQQDYRLRTEGGAVRSARFPWSEQLLADLGALTQEPPEADAARRLGEQMRRFLDVLDWGGHEHAFESAPGSGKTLRLVLRSAAAELYALPWELVTLKDSGRHLAELPEYTLRYEWPWEHEHPPRAVTPREGRLLYAWSAAGGMVPAEEHLQALLKTRRQGGLPFDPRQDVLSRVSLRSLEERLKSAPEPVSVLHVLCHGAPLSSQSSQLYGLAWNKAGDEAGSQVVDGGALASVLAPHSDTLRMVVLCACQGGDSGQLASHLGSVAQALHRANIEMVLASRLPLSAEGSVLLTETLYRKLLVESCSLEEALGAARHELRVAGMGFDWASLQLYARRHGRVDLRPVALRPYCGLLAFGPEHRRFFFGRSKLEAMLLERVQQAAGGQRPRFQVVAGASGTGKSSVVMAGLVPLLRTEEWDWLAVRPGELVRTGVRREAAHSLALQELRNRLHRLWSSEPLPAEGGATEEALLEEAQRLRQARPKRKLLLVLDQLEEAFTQLGGQERQALMKGVWALARTPELECVLVATLRVDYFERCGGVVLDGQTRLDTVVYADEHRLFVPEMGLEEVAEAIEQPARKVGLELEPGLVDRLCKDVGQEPGSLPLLGHALDLLWQKREGRLLTHHAYEELGGVGGALTRTAEQLYTKLSEDERVQARRLLVRLVAVRDLGSPRAQGRVWAEEMRPQEGTQREAFEAALEKLVSGRLLVKGNSGEEEERGAWVQLAHEALLRRWERLEQWVEEDWEREQQLGDLEKWAEEWEAHLESEDRGASFLLAGDRLGYAKSLRERFGGELSPRCRRLIEASHAVEEHRQNEERAREEHEKAMLRDLSEARTRTAKVFQRAFMAVAVLLVVAVGALVVGARLRRQELEQRRIAQHTSQLLMAKMVREEDPIKSLLILREMKPDAKDQVWVETALDVLQRPVPMAVLQGHEAGLAMAAFSPDGTRIVTASDDKTARVWSTDGKLLAILQDPGGSVNSAAFSPDGRWVVTASDDTTARVWSAKDGSLLATLEGHGDGVVSAVYSPDGTKVLTASRDKVARVWGEGYTLVAELPRPAGTSPEDTGRLAKRPQGTGSNREQSSLDPVIRLPRDAVSLDFLLKAAGRVFDRQGIKAAFSPDGQYVVTALDGTARVWSVKSGLPTTLDDAARCRPHIIVAGTRTNGGPERVISAAFSPDSRKVVTTADDGAWVWSMGECLVKTPLVGHGARVVSAVFSPDGSSIVTASWDRTARIWSVDGKLTALLQGHGGNVVGAAFSPDGRLVVTASEDRTARLWRAKDGVLLATLEGHRDGVVSAVFSPDGKSIVTASRDKKARVWRTEDVLPGGMEGHTGYYRGAAFSPDGRRVVTPTGNMTAQVWSVEGVLLAQLEGHGGPVFSAAFSPDGRRVVTASGDRTARVWRAEGGQVARLEGHDGDVISAAFSPDGQRVVTASGDRIARVWRAEGGLLARLEGHSAGVLSAAFSPDGQRVVTASIDRTARVWRAEGGLLARLEGHSGMVFSAAFSPDGQRVVTASEDGTARVWSKEGALLARLEGHDENVRSATFSPDGQWVVTASDDQTARVWNADGRQVAVFKSNQGRLHRAAFSGDGERVVCVSVDGTVREWPVSVRLLMERLEQATRMCLDVKERQTYLNESPEEALVGYDRCQREHGPGFRP